MPFLYNAGLPPPLYNTPHLFLYACYFSSAHRPHMFLDSCLLMQSAWGPTLTTASVIYVLYSSFLIRDTVFWCSHMQIRIFQYCLAFALVIIAVVVHHDSRDENSLSPFHRPRLSLFSTLLLLALKSAALMFPLLVQVRSWHSWYMLPTLPYILPQTSWYLWIQNNFSST